MVNIGQENPSSLLETIKEGMQPESIAHKFGVDKNMLIDIGLYGSIGFIVGFLLKKYSEYFIAFVLLMVALIVLQQFDYISLSVNAAKMGETLGLESMPLSLADYGSFIWARVKAHVVGSSSFIVGFLIGIKIG
jgi:uncharacterized membrane protein (Fun14 family)